MLVHKIKYIFFLISLSILLYLLLFYGGSIIFNTTQSIAGIALAITLFLGFELFVILYTDKRNKTISSRKSINLFFAYKVGRILASLLFVAIYATVTKVELKSFLVVFLILYLVFLFFDTAYFVKREKVLKTNETKNKEIENLNK